MTRSKGVAEILILKISDLARGGAGVGRDLSGRVVFVPFSAPQDLLRVQIVEESKTYAWGEIVEILEPSPLRVKPPCPIFGQCGGCQWQHIPYALQWRTKLIGVAESLKRVQIHDHPPIDEYPAEKVWHYRNRIQLRGKENLIGFFSPRSQALVPAKNCEISHPLINAEWEKTRKLGEELRSPYKVEVEVDAKKNRIKRAWNEPHSASGFKQVHDDQNEEMKKWIQSALPSGEILLDLFGGSGNFSRTLKSHFKEIHCVDLTTPKNEALETKDGLFFHRSLVKNWLSKQDPAKYRTKGAAILDPPRAGLGRDGKEIVNHLKQLSIHEVVMVGCQSDSFAKDLLQFTLQGFKIVKLAAFDFFPQTYHVESIAYLKRENNEK